MTFCSGQAVSKILLFIDRDFLSSFIFVVFSNIISLHDLFADKPNLKPYILTEAFESLWV